MSRVCWQKTLLPNLESPAGVWESPFYKDQILNVRAYEEDSAKISIPDAKAFRSMSRASVFMSSLCMQASEILRPFLNRSPFSVGVYCAVENGPIDAASTAKILEQNDPAQFAEFYRKFRNPKMYLKQLPNLVPAQMGISMGLQGPMNVYTHSLFGSLHALEQAEWDLKTGLVEAALVCTAHAFDDFMVMKRSRSAEHRCLTEGAAAILLVKDGTFTDWPSQVKRDEDNFFGISDQLINFVKGAAHV